MPTFGKHIVQRMKEIRHNLVDKPILHKFVVECSSHSTQPFRETRAAKTEDLPAQRTLHGFFDRDLLRKLAQIHRLREGEPPGDGQVQEYFWDKNAVRKYVNERLEEPSEEPHFRSWNRAQEIREMTTPLLEDEFDSTNLSQVDSFNSELDVWDQTSADDVYSGIDSHIPDQLLPDYDCNNDDLNTLERISSVDNDGSKNDRDVFDRDQPLVLEDGYTTYQTYWRYYSSQGNADQPSEYSNDEEQEIEVRISHESDSGIAERREVALFEAEQTIKEQSSFEDEPTITEEPLNKDDVKIIESTSVPSSTCHNPIISQTFVYDCRLGVNIPKLLKRSRQKLVEKAKSKGCTFNTLEDESWEYWISKPILGGKRKYRVQIKYSARLATTPAQAKILRDVPMEKMAMSIHPGLMNVRREKSRVSGKENPLRWYSIVRRQY